MSTISPTSIQTNGDDLSIQQDYYKNASSDKIRCKEGEVFTGSYTLLGDDEEDMDILGYSGSTWTKGNGDAFEANHTWTGSGIECQKKYCKPLGIVDSNKEFDAIVDTGNNDVEEVICNKGYVFDTTDTRMGKVECAAIPNETGDLTKPTEMAWIVIILMQNYFVNQKLQKLIVIKRKYPTKYLKIQQVNYMILVKI